MIQVFSKEWFEKYQTPLLWLANNYYGKQILGISRKHTPFYDLRIDKIEPNAIYHQPEPGKVLAEFRSHDKYGKRMYYNFKYIWEILHWWDMNVANNFKIQELNFGFDTLTIYPDSGSGSTTVDGQTYNQGKSLAWADMIVEAAAYAYTNYTTDEITYRRSDTVTDKWDGIKRLHISFDTSSIGSGKQVDNATLSFYRYTAADQLAIDANVYGNSLTDSNNVVTGDHNSIGNTAYCDTPLTYSDFTSSGYKDLDYNTTGKSNVNMTGISEYGIKSTAEASGVSPTWVYNRIGYLTAYMADYGGNTYDPKLYIEYSSAGGARRKFLINS